MNLPKPLFPIAGNPIIYHHVRALARIPNMNEIYLIGFFESGEFDSFLREMQKEFPTVHLRYLREYQAMGTAGGLFHFRDQILMGNPDAFFVLNGDIASSFPLQEMLATHHKAKNAIGTILSSHMDVKKLSRYGCVVVDEDTNQVQHFVEKPESFVSDLISCGIYIFCKEVFECISLAADSRAKLDRENGMDISQFEHKMSLAAVNVAQTRVSDRVQLEDDLLPVLALRKSLYAHVLADHDFWIPVKTGSSTIAANRLYLQHFMHSNPKRLIQPEGSSPVSSAVTPSFYPVRSATSPEPIAPSPTSRTHPEVMAPAYIHPTAVIHPSAKIGPNAFIGPGVVMGRGVRVRDAIILDGVEINNESVVMNAVVGWESKIGQWVRVEGSGGKVSEENNAATQKGFKVPSAAILGKGVVVSDELIIRDCIVLPHKELKQSFHREILM